MAQPKQKERAFYIVTRYSTAETGKRATTTSALKRRASFTDSSGVVTPTRGAEQAPTGGLVSATERTRCSVDDFYVHPQTCIIANTQASADHEDRFPDVTQSHQRIHMRHQEEGVKRTRAQQIHDLIGEAVRDGQHYVVLAAFVIVPRKRLIFTYRARDAHDEDYEVQTNDYEPRLLTRDDLFMAMLRFPEEHTELHHICDQLELYRVHGLRYVLYNRRIAIELVKKPNGQQQQQSDENALLQWLLQLLAPSVSTKPRAEYYSIVVNLSAYRPAGRHLDG